MAYGPTAPKSSGRPLSSCIKKENENKETTTKTNNRLIINLTRLMFSGGDPAVFSPLVPWPGLVQYGSVGRSDCDQPLAYSLTYLSTYSLT